MRTFEQVRQRVLVFVVCTLSVTVLLKIGEIQYLELILAADFLVVCALFFLTDYAAESFRHFLVWVQVGQSFLSWLSC